MTSDKVSLKKTTRIIVAKTSEELSSYMTTQLYNMFDDVQQVFFVDNPNEFIRFHKDQIGPCNTIIIIQDRCELLPDFKYVQNIHNTTNREFMFSFGFDESGKHLGIGLASLQYLTTYNHLNLNINVKLAKYRRCKILNNYLRLFKTQTPSGPHQVTNGDQRNKQGPPPDKQQSIVQRLLTGGTLRTEPISDRKGAQGRSYKPLTSPRYEPSKDDPLVGFIVHITEGSGEGSILGMLEMFKDLEGIKIVSIVFAVDGISRFNYELAERYCAEFGDNVNIVTSDKYMGEVYSRHIAAQMCEYDPQGSDPQGSDPQGGKLASSPRDVNMICIKQSQCIDSQKLSDMLKLKKAMNADVLFSEDKVVIQPLELMKKFNISKLYNKETDTWIKTIPTSTLQEEMNKLNMKGVNSKIRL